MSQPDQTRLTEELTKAITDKDIYEAYDLFSEISAPSQEALDATANLALESREINIAIELKKRGAVLNQTLVDEYISNALKSGEYSNYDIIIFRYPKLNIISFSEQITALGAKLDQDLLDSLAQKACEDKEVEKVLDLLEYGAKSDSKVINDFLSNEFELMKPISWKLFALINRGFKLEQTTLDKFAQNRLKVGDFRFLEQLKNLGANIEQSKIDHDPEDSNLGKTQISTEVYQEQSQEQLDKAVVKALKSNSLQEVGKLLGRGAKLDQKTLDNHTNKLLITDELDYIPQLVKFGAKLDQYWLDNLLQESIENNEFTRADILKALGANFEQKILDEFVLAACENKQIENVKWLIEFGAKIEPGKLSDFVNAGLEFSKSSEVLFLKDFSSLMTKDSLNAAVLNAYEKRDKDKALALVSVLGNKLEQGLLDELVTKEFKFLSCMPQYKYDKLDQFELNLFNHLLSMGAKIDQNILDNKANAELKFGRYDILNHYRTLGANLNQQKLDETVEKALENCDAYIVQILKNLSAKVSQDDLNKCAIKALDIGVYKMKEFINLGAIIPQDDLNKLANNAFENNDVYMAQQLKELGAILDPDLLDKKAMQYLRDCWLEEARNVIYLNSSTYKSKAWTVYEFMKRILYYNHGSFTYTTNPQEQAIRHGMYRAHCKANLYEEVAQASMKTKLDAHLVKKFFRYLPGLQAELYIKAVRNGDKDIAHVIKTIPSADLDDLITQIKEKIESEYLQPLNDLFSRYTVERIQEIRLEIIELLKNDGIEISQEALDAVKFLGMSSKEIFIAKALSAIENFIVKTAECISSPLECIGYSVDTTLIGEEPSKEVEI